MKILSIGLDNSILNKNSRLAKRVREYGGLVDKYIVIVSSDKKAEVEISDKVKAYGVKAKNKLMGLFKIYSFITKILKNEKFDVITVQDQYFLAKVGLYLARKFKIGLEIQVHGFEKYKGIRKLVAKYVIPKATSLRVVSQRLKRQMISEYGVEEDKITVVPIYTKRITHNVERITYKDKMIFLTVGRLMPVKNIIMQVKAMKKVVKHCKEAELWIAGDGPERNNLEVRSKKLEEEEYIKFLGWQNNLEKFYQQADIFLLTSNQEGWGLAVIEAAGYELPIIMTDVGCAGEVIKNNESGIVIPIGDQEALEQAMIKLIEDKNLRKRLGKNAREAIKKVPSKEETLNLYKRSWEKARL